MVCTLTEDQVDFLGHNMWPQLKGFTSTANSFVDGVKWGVNLK